MKKSIPHAIDLFQSGGVGTSGLVAFGFNTCSQSLLTFGQSLFFAESDNGSATKSAIPTKWILIIFSHPQARIEKRSQPHREKPMLHLES